MEIGAIASVLGLGWYLSKSQDTNVTDENKIPVVHGPNDTMYHSSQLARAKIGDATHGMLMNAKSLQGQDKGKVIPEQTPHRVNLEKGQHVEDPSRFVHNNMQPFFGGRVKQDMRTGGFESKLERFTGMDTYRRVKTEQTPMFEPRPNIGHVFGTPSNTEMFSDRMARSRYVGNEKAFEEVRVGPGLGNGFTAKPEGGFQQAKTLDYSKPKNVDELRVSTNPKLSFKGRVVRGTSAVPLRGDIGQVSKWKPDRFFKMTKDRYLVTTGAFVREKQRPLVVLKETQRIRSRHLQGHAVSQDAKAMASRPEVQESKRQQLEDVGLRNASDVRGRHGDYGIEGYYAGPTERTITGLRNYLGPIGETVSAVVAPIMDSIRPTKKEDFIVNRRPEGQMAVREKPRVWDPNDVARTTTKETLIHGATLNNPRAVEADKPRLQLQDTARTTQKEGTLIEGHIQQAKTTISPEAPRDAYTENAVQNSHREGTLVGRIPATQGAKQAIDGEKYGELNHTKLDGDRVNTRGMGNAAPISGGQNADPIGRIGENTKVTEDDRTFKVNMERIGSYQLKPLSTNPFV